MKEIKGQLEGVMRDFEGVVLDVRVEGIGKGVERFLKSLKILDEDF